MHPNQNEINRPRFRCAGIYTYPSLLPGFESQMVRQENDHKQYDHSQHKQHTHRHYDVHHLTIVCVTYSTTDNKESIICCSRKISSLFNDDFLQ
jgi:hypothetical protein